MPDPEIISSCSLFGWFCVSANQVDFVQERRCFAPQQPTKNRSTLTICYHLLVSHLSFSSFPERLSGGGTAGRPDSTPSRFAFWLALFGGALKHQNWVVATQLFFLFTTILGRIPPSWRAYFSDGVVQPPSKKKWAPTNFASCLLGCFIFAMWKNGRPAVTYLDVPGRKLGSIR